MYLVLYLELLTSGASNFASVMFKNSEITGGGEVTIKWDNKDLKQI